MTEEKEKGDKALQVERFLIEDAYHALIAFLEERGELRIKGKGTTIVASCPGGIEIYLESNLTLKDLELLNLASGGALGEHLLIDPSQICVSSEDNWSLKLNRFDPRKLGYRLEDPWTMRETCEDANYAVDGEGTPEEITERINRLLGAMASAQHENKDFVPLSIDETRQLQQERIVS